MRAWICAVVVLAGCLVLPLSAAAAPPSLQGPGGGTSVTEGSSVTYEWSGELQGDPAERNRSFFVVEVIAASKMPSGQQAEWPDADTRRPTAPGSATTSIDLGAPPAGDWKWRVCAWGVVNANVATTVEQIPDGCSSARTLTSAVRSDNLNGEVTVVDEKRTVTEARPPTVVEKPRPADPSSATPTPTESTPVANDPTVTEVEEPAEVKIERSNPMATSGRSRGSKGSKGGSRKFALGGGEALAGDIAADGSSADATVTDRGAVASAVSNGLSATVPGVPIPFWTLLFLFASLPVAIAWRRNVMSMFDWSDGSIDGYGTQPSEAAPVLASVQRARSAQAFPTRTDGSSVSTSTTEAPRVVDAA